MRGRLKAVLFVAALVLLVFALRSRSTSEITREVPLEEGSPKPTGQKTDAGLAEPNKMASRPPPRKASRTCLSGAAQQCFQGDVWSLDSCDVREEKLEECGARLCAEGACARVDSKPCTEPAQGRCDGDIVRACVAGRSRNINCASSGLRCAMGEEGAECLPRIPAELRCKGPTRCDGEVLVACEAGATVRTNCRKENARCLTLADSDEPACVRLKPAEASACGPCGCSAKSGAEEALCDAKDDDGDGLVDEALDCGPLPIIAFLVTDNAGQSSHAPADVEEEIARANQLLATSESSPAPQVELSEIIELRDQSLLKVDGAEVARLATDSRVHPTRPEFYVPMIFTDVVVAGGETPRLGISTLPNGTCGGLQRSVGPEVGVVVLAKERATTTVVHELGHFLGLCHTHEDPAQHRRVAAIDATTTTACSASCRGEGDGICDTPPDPGPEVCPYNAACSTSCRDGSSPDATNLMSYYTECRRNFTDEQILTMQHTMALRRAWHRCVGQACACHPGAADCPVGMSCRPFHGDDAQTLFRCALDGPLGPGADCERANLCGQGTTCLSVASLGVKRCVRTCAASSASCTCIEANEVMRVCAEDVAQRAM